MSLRVTGKTGPFQEDNTLHQEQMPTVTPANTADTPDSTIAAPSAASQPQAGSAKPRLPPRSSPQAHLSCFQFCSNKSALSYVNTL